MVGKYIRSGRQNFDIRDSGYGKAGVQLLYISRITGRKHTARELEVTTKLQLSTEKEYTDGDNRDIVGTDSQKNIVYVLAKKYGVSSPEEFALLVCQFFLDTYSHVVTATVTVVEVPWNRIPMDGVPHNHAFVHTPTAERWASVTINRKDPPLLRSGLRGLRVLKTTQSAFKDFLRDEFRTLVDTDDRIFSTVVASEWTYSSHIGVDFDKAWDKVLDCILNKFAGPPEEGILSHSVQNTLYLACAHALDSVPQISRIQMDMPNKHYFGVDLSPFPKDLVGVGENKTVYLPADKPYGFIHAALQRHSSPKL